ncbi:hypothetical protein DSO57_1002273 [Entomophthora muscae]|uniref:Uncharacterized protein n=1 Tax=Entomophthora muscae TaxID=34485 RepID=A0ACC2TJM7_9FUNG|nr:hypothetical protein DSO57_1002273 [Entomophthora muscae]
MKSETPAESAHDYSNQPMKTSPLVDTKVMGNQPIETSSLVELGYQSMKTSPLRGTNPYMRSETMGNSPMDTHNTPEEVELARHQKPNLLNAAYPSIQHDDFDSVVS